MSAASIVILAWTSLNVGTFIGALSYSGTSTAPDGWEWLRDAVLWSWLLNIGAAFVVALWPNLWPLLAGLAGA